MKNQNKGFIVPVLIGIIVLLIIGGGVYIYESKKVETPVSSADTEVQNYSSVPTATNNQQNQVNQKITLDMSPMFNQNYKTVLTQAFGEPADFNGHYVVASISCGSGCFTYAVIDKNTGKVYQVPKINDVGVYRGDIGQPYSLSNNQIKIVADNGSKINTYSFNGTSFSLVSSVDSSTPSSSTSFKTYSSSKYGYSYQYPAFASIGYVNGSIDNPNIDFGNNIQNITASVNSTAGDVTIQNCFTNSLLSMVVNGITFHLISNGDQVEGGVTHQSTTYATVRNNRCYQISMNLQFSIPTNGSYDPGPRKMTEDYFSKILASFKFTN